MLLSLEKPLCKLVSMIDIDGGNVNPLDYQVREEGGDKGGRGKGRNAARGAPGRVGRASVNLKAGSDQCLIARPPPHPAQIVPNFRVRSIPVLGTTPALFGMAAASYVLCHLAGVPWQVGRGGGRTTLRECPGRWAEGGAGPPCGSALAGG